jgi:hypothetical protein
VIDSSNTLHMFFGNRLSGSPDIHGLWHSIWKDGGWSLPEAIVSGPKRTAGATGENAFDPAQTQAMVVDRNLLMVVWRQDPGSGGVHIHYTYTQLNTPDLPHNTPPAPLPSPEATQANIDSDSFPPTQTPVFLGDPAPDHQDINATIFNSILPAMAFILALFIILILRVRR